MNADFSHSLELLLATEGGYVNNPHDPGGATNKGIIQRVYDAYRRMKSLPPTSVRNITPADVADIYKLQYWDAVRGDAIPAGIDYCLFDESANSGPVKSIIDLQTALKVKADGQFGIVTFQALQSVVDRVALINRICDLRLSFLHRLRTWRFFGRGWTARVSRVRVEAITMATH